jgi:hypothetical protein
MESATFRKWLEERGCRFGRHEHEDRQHGHAVVIVHREARTSSAPDLREVRRVCEELGLDWSELPGPKSRV